MCGRYTLRSSPVEIAKILGFKTEIEAKPRYNIAPSQDIIIARYGERKEGEIVNLKWGLIPSFIKDPKQSPKPINARAETVLEKTFFRRAFKTQRCLVPANGYYEWQSVGKIKQPYLIHMRDDALFFFAGIWESFTSQNGEILETALIITTDASSKVAKIHHRMPVILRREYYYSWLDTENHDLKFLTSMLTPYPDDHIHICAVSTIVNSGKNETPECIVPLEAKGK